MNFGFRKFVPSNDPALSDAYIAECHRKEKLMQAFEALEIHTRAFLRREKRQSTDRVFRDGALVTKVFDGHLELRRDNGEVIDKIAITQEIRKHIRKRDHLLIMAESRNGQWYFTYVTGICSPVY